MHTLGGAAPRAVHRHAAAALPSGALLLHGGLVSAREDQGGDKGEAEPEGGGGAVSEAWLLWPGPDAARGLAAGQATWQRVKACGGGCVRLPARAGHSLVALGDVDGAAGGGVLVIGGEAGPLLRVTLLAPAPHDDEADNGDQVAARRSDTACRAPDGSRCAEAQPSQ